MEEVLSKLSEVLGITINAADGFGNWVITAISQYAAMKSIHLGIEFATYCVVCIALIVAIIAMVRRAKKIYEIYKDWEDVFLEIILALIFAAILLCVFLLGMTALSDMLCWAITPDAMMLSYLIDIMK